MKSLLLFCLWFGATTTWAADGRDRYAGMRDFRHDQVLEREVVPAEDPPQGEVQVVRRGDLLVVRTLLVSRVLKRVAAVINAKEIRNWPETRTGHLASTRYREELFRATEQAWEAFTQRSDRSELRQTLCIEFILASDNALITLSLPRLKGDYGQFDLIDRQELTTWRASRDYVAENMLEIVKDSFRLEDERAAALLAPLWPGR